MRGRDDQESWNGDFRLRREVYTKKTRNKQRETKYMLLYRHQNVGQNQDIKITTRSFGNVS
jgi:hypothetical protein